MTDPAKLADSVAGQLNFKIEDKQDLLERSSLKDRIEKLLELMQSEIEIAEIEKKIRDRVKKQMEKSQKEYYLSEQMRAIQKEMGEKDDFKNEIAELEEQLSKKNLPPEADAKVRKEIRKLKLMSPMSARRRLFGTTSIGSLFFRGPMRRKRSWISTRHSGFSTKIITA